MNPETYDLAARVEQDHWWFSARREILGVVLDRFCVSGGEQSVLEVGCGNGGNLPLLSRFGSLYAVEMEDRARERALARKIGKVEKGWLPDRMPFAGMRFDLVAALDVIEHLEDDATAIRVLKGVLKPDGLLLLAVPAYMWLWSVHDEMAHHKRRYTRAKLQSLVEQCGLRVTYASYFNTLLFPVGAAYAKLGSLLGASPGQAMLMPASPVNSLLRSIFSMERHLLPGFSLPFGVSIVLCARMA